MTIKTKFAIFNVSLVLLLALGLGFFFIFSLKRSLEEDVRERALILARRLATEVYDGSLRHEEKLLQAIQRLLKEQDYAAGARVLDTSGKILASNDIREVGKFLPPQEWPPIGGARINRNKESPFVEAMVPLQSTAHSGGEEFLLDQAKTESGVRLSPSRLTGSVEVLYSMEPVRTVLRRTVRWTIGLVGLAALLSIGVVFWILNILLFPLRLLKEGADRLGAGHLEHRVAVVSNDELANLAQSLNAMAGKLSGTLKDLEASKLKLEEWNRTLETRILERTAELKKAQDTLLQSEKMAAIGQLAGGVAHEINNPLAVILGFAQSMLRHVTPEDNTHMPLKSIEREVNRCRNLVRDLLTFARAGQPEREYCDLHQTIDGALTLVEAQSKSRSLEIVKQYDRSLPEAFVNSNKIQQIVINLCNNAMDAMPEGGTITIKTARLDKAFNGKDGVELTVSDTGTGIPKEILTEIFNPFFTTKPQGEGTGLGLSLVYEIVQMHNGTIQVESQEGQGTIFRVALPLKNPIPSEQEEPTGKHTAT